MIGMPVKYAKHIALVILLVVWAGISWYKNNPGWHFTKTPPRPAKIPAVITTDPPAGATVDGEAPVIALIDWLDPRDPRAIPFLSSNIGRGYLFETRAGLQYWDDYTRQLRPLEMPLANARLDDHIWMDINAGPASGQAIMMVTGQSPAVAKLFLYGGRIPKLQRQFDFPNGFIPSAFVKLTESTVLFCSQEAQKSIVVRYEKSGFAQADSTTIPSYDQEIFARAGVAGTVEGFGNMTLPIKSADGRGVKPLFFDTQRCAWSARNLPEPLASGLQLSLVQSEIATFSSAPVIVAANWIDPVTKEPRTLTTPLVWSQADQRWRKRQPALYPGVDINMLNGMGRDSRSIAVSLPDRKIAFLLPDDDQWRDALQRLPAADHIKLLNFDWRSIYAIPADGKSPGRIVRIDAPLSSERQGDFTNAQAYIGLHQGELMIIKGSQSEATLITPKEHKGVAQATMPQHQGHPSGVQLADGSVLVFGGLDPDCRSYAWPRCSAAPQASFRWLPAEKRWQSVPSLSMPFATGTVLNDNDGSLVPRNDYVLKNGNELFYLTTNGSLQGERSAASHLYRWTPDGAAETLARTRVNRQNASLIELNDGRLAAIGGAAAGEPPSPVCEVCLARRKMLLAEAAAKIAKQRAQRGEGNNESEDEPDPETTVPPCPVCDEIPVRQDLKLARSCEIYDRKTDSWTFGPAPNHAGGKAFKLANGRIFKFGLAGYSTADADYVAETADTLLGQWTAAPPFPFPKPAAVKHVLAIGNQVLIVMEKPSDQYVIWDDATRQWNVHDLPSRTDWSMRNLPDHVHVTDDGRLLLVFRDRFEYHDWPLK
jgi:hypothetical protein